MLRKLVLGVLCAADLLVSYLFIGNLMRGLNGVVLIGQSDVAHFLGYYMLAGGYLALLLICIAATAVAYLLVRRSKRVQPAEVDAASNDGQAD